MLDACWILGNSMLELLDARNLVLEGAGYSLMLEIQCSYSLDPRKNGARPFATLSLKLGFE